MWTSNAIVGMVSATIHPRPGARDGVVTAMSPGLPLATPAGILRRPRVNLTRSGGSGLVALLGSPQSVGDELPVALAEVLQRGIST
jgi:hypothetical protein